MFYLLMFWSCGGSKPDLQSPENIAVIPFEASPISPPSVALNQKLLYHLGTRYRITALQSLPALYQLENFAQISFPSTGSMIQKSLTDTTSQVLQDSSISNNIAMDSTVIDSATNVAMVKNDSTPMVDSTFALTDTPRWILTGKYIQENEKIAAGTRVPFLLYAPSSKIIARVEFRLYDLQNQSWMDIQQISVEKKQKGGWQIIDYDPADPGLAINANDRQIMRDEIYESIFQKMMTSMDKIIKKQKETDEKMKAEK